MSVSHRAGSPGHHHHCRKIDETDDIIVYRCKGSDKNGGREQDVTYHKRTGKTTTTDSARADYEKKHGTLPKDVDVDHKNNNKDDNRMSNLQKKRHPDNTAKENKRRAKEKD